MTTPEISCFDLSGNRIWETAHPAQVEILARFGAEDSSGLVALHEGASTSGISIGDSIEVRFGEHLKFRGKITEIRTDSTSFPVVIRGMRRPARLFRGDIRGAFEQSTPTEILAETFNRLTDCALQYDGLPASNRVLDRLDFRGVPLFHAVDLLAKLAGNWLWWIDWDSGLHFVPPDSNPEWTWYFAAEHLRLRPGLWDREVKNEFVFHGGVSGGAEYTRYFQDTGSKERFGLVPERIFARAIATDATFAYLRDAVLAECPRPTTNRTVDRLDGDLSASFGQRFELRGNPLPRLDEAQIFRIAAEEITWTEEKVLVRYHLAHGLESSSRYTRYIDHDTHGASLVSASLGPFALDFSALDSEAHLDS